MQLPTRRMETVRRLLRVRFSWRGALRQKRWNALSESRGNARHRANLACTNGLHATTRAVSIKSIDKSTLQDFFFFM